MAMAATTSKNGKMNRSNSSPPSLRQQLKFIKTIYQTLTNVYFLLIEQGASTSIASTKNALTIQMTSLKAQIRGEILEQASTSRSQTPSGLQTKPSTGGLSDLRPEHRKQIKDIHLFEVLLRPNVGTKGNISSNSTQNAFIPSLKQAIQAIEVINEILNDLMERANVHAANQVRIRELVAAIEQRDTTMVKSIRKLANLRESCHRLVKFGKEEEESIKRAESKPLSYDDILHYARTLSQTTTAPPGFKLQFDEEGERSHDLDPVDAQSGDQPVKKRKLFQLAGDDDDEAEAGKNGQIPSHLQDKLPFPSIDAIRRGASVIRPPTWDMFQKGILQMDQEEVDGNPETHVHMAEYTRTSTSASKSQPKKPQPVEEEEDGFGLDLN